MSRRDHRNTYDAWYDLAVWARRKRRQLQEFPFCKFCFERGETTIATIVDHVQPHRGDWTKFRLGDVQSLCYDCHNGAKKMIENRGFDTRIGADGMPVDPRHPVYKGSQRPSGGRS